MQRNRSFYTICLIEICMIGLFICCSGRLDTLNPTIDQRVLDYANILTTTEEDSLFNLINEIRVSIGPHLGIVIIDSLNGKTIEQFAFDTFEKIRLGRMAYKDGILIAISMKEKLIRVDTGEGIVAIVNDDEAEFINTKIISPKFKEENYFDGLLDAIHYIRNKLEPNKAYFNRLNKEL